METRGRRYLLGLAGLVATLVLAVMAAWFLIDAEQFKPRIEQAASRALDAEFEVGGDVRTRLFPGPGLRLEDIRISDGEAPWLEAPAMHLRVKLLPLARGDVRIRSLGLVEPEFHLRRDTDGRLNFLPDRLDPEDIPDQTTHLRRIRARDLSLTFTDELSDEEHRIQACSIRGDMPGNGATEIIDGALRLPDFEARIECEGLASGQSEISGLRAHLEHHQGRIRLDRLEGQMFGGGLAGEMDFDLTGPGGHELKLILEGFELAQFVETFHEGQALDGTADFSSEVVFSGLTMADMVESLEGTAELGGSEWILHGQDLDEALGRYESSQQFNLVDVGALVVAGPAGLAVTRGYSFASLFQDHGEQTPVNELVSNWDISGGRAGAGDVAFSTAKNRLAVTGGLDFVGRRFDEMIVAVVDREGCAMVEQKIQGSFQNPEIDEPNFLETIAGPVISLVEQGVEVFRDEDCEIFYDGSVEHPRD